MEEEAALIYGLEFQARAICSQAGETENVRFFVGTQSLKFDNQIHLLEWDEESNSLNKHVFSHPYGEIWSLRASPSQSHLLAAVYSSIQDDQSKKHGALYRVKGDLEPADGSEAQLGLEQICLLDTTAYGSVQSLLWQPNEGNKLLALIDHTVLIYDTSHSQNLTPRLSTQGALSASSKTYAPFTAGAWSPHQGGYSVATGNENGIQGWDLRTLQNCVWSVEGAHAPSVRDLDFNPNRQYVLASCGDDGRTCFWDIRHPRTPLQTRQDHAHWAWTVRYNHYHDQLILTAGSDCRVILSSVASLSSEPLGHMVDDDDVDKPEQEPLADGVIAIYEEHEDSVYAVAWSAVDPWMFASVSYDGRLVVHRVPRHVKYNILQ